MSTKIKITTEAQAIKAVKADAYHGLSKVPYELRTAKVCAVAAKLSGNYSTVITMMPPEHRTFTMIYKAAPTYGKDTKNFLEGVADSLFGLSISSLTALIKKGTVPNMSRVADEYVDEINEIVWRKAFYEDKEVITRMPKEVANKIIAKSDLHSIINFYKSTGSWSSKWDGYTLMKYIPSKLKKDALKPFQEKLKKALGEKDYISFREIDAYWMTPELYLLAVQKRGDNLAYVPEEFKTEKICKAAVEEDGDALEYVPQDKKSSFYVDAVKSGEGLDKIPQEDRSEKLCTLAVEANVDAIKDIPQGKKSYAICLAAVDQKAELIEEVPQEHIDEEMIIRLIMSVFNENWKSDFVIAELWDYRKEKGHEKAMLSEVFDNFFKHKEDNYKRAEEIGVLLHEMIKRDASMYFKALKFSGDYEDNFNSKLFTKYFGGIVKFEHAVTTAQTDIKKVSGFPQDVQAKVWEHFLKTGLKD